MALGEGALGVEPLGGGGGDSGTTISLGLATETDSARPLRLAVALGRASETDTARPITPKTVITLGRATETDTARAVTSRQVLTLGRASQTETASPISLGGVTSIPLGRATEADTARSITPIVNYVIPLGRAVETDTARSIPVALKLGRATDTETARPITVVQRKTLGRATETDTAQPITQPSSGTPIDLVTDSRIPYTGANQVSGTSVTFDAFTFIDVCFAVPVLGAGQTIVLEITGNIPDDFTIYSGQDPDDIYGGTNSSLHTNAGSGSVGSKTVEITIGTGIEDYDTAIAAGEVHFGIIMGGSPTIDSITYSVSGGGGGGPTLADIVELSLHSDNPGLDGSNDIGLPHQAITWSGPVSEIFTSNQVTFTVPAGTTVKYVGGWDADGNFVASFPLSIFFDENTTYSLAAQYRDHTGTLSGFSLFTDLYEVDLDFQIAVLDDVIRRAPSAITVVVDGGRPEQEIRFYMDTDPGTALAYTTVLNVSGGLEPTSLVITGDLGGMQGIRTLVAQQDTDTGTITATATYTVERDPSAAPATQGPDLDPVEIPGALVGDVRRWVLQDLLPEEDGGIGSYIMPINPDPSKTGTPRLEKALRTHHTTSKATGMYHVYESGNIAKQWVVGGSTISEEMDEQLRAYRRLNRRFYVIDHRNRAWKVAVEDLQIVPHLRTNYNGEMTDWFSDYTFTFVVLDQQWVTPV